MAAHNVGEETEAIIAVTHTLSRTTGKTSLGIQTSCHAANAFLSKILTVDELFIHGILNAHLFGGLIHYNTRKWEISAAMAHQMPDFHWFGLIFICKFRDISGNRIIYVQNAILLHLHNRQCGKGFCYGCHTKNRVSCNRKLIFCITVSEVILVLDLPCGVDDAKCNSPCLAIFHYTGNQLF